LYHGYDSIDVTDDHITSCKLRSILTLPPHWNFTLSGTRFTPDGKLIETVSVTHAALLLESGSHRLADGSYKTKYSSFLLVGGGYSPGGWVGKFIIPFGPGADEVKRLPMAWSPRYMR
jgi:hypothetical protein